MSPAKKRTLFAVMVVILLSTACAPASAPAPTQDPVSVQQKIEQSVVMSVTAYYAQTIKQQTSTALLTPTLTPEPTQNLPTLTASTSLPAESGSGFPDLTDVTTPGTESASGFPDLTDVTTPGTEPASGSLETTDVTPTNTEDWGQDYCEIFLQSTLQVKENEIHRLPRQLEVGMNAVVTHHVNLRTRPSLRSRILLILKPEARVEIIDGPIETPVETHYQNGTKYVWWQVKLPGGLTGWSAELSVCRQFYFMEPK